MSNRKEGVEMENKEIGKIINDEACFLNVNFTANVFSGEISVDLDYDKRIIENKEKLEEVTREYLDKVEECYKEEAKIAINRFLNK